MPEVWNTILQQFPVAAIVGGIAWYAYREVKTSNTSHNKEVAELHKNAVSDMKEANAAAVAALQAEIAQLKDSLREELKKVGEKMDELKRSVGG